MNREHLTLVVPTKNEAANIGRFLDSVPYGMRVIIVDASEDATPDIIRRRQRPRLKIIRDPGNIPAARQLAAEAAHTEWLLFSDADVVFGEGYFEALEEICPGDRQAALVGAKLSRRRYRWYYFFFSQWMRCSCAIGLPSASGSNMIIRRQALLDVGGFDCGLSCNEDSEVIWRLHRRRYGVAYDSRLRVYEFDHRRLDSGLLRKTAHSVMRCGLLFCGLGRFLRNRDWGYWASRPGWVRR